MSAVPPAAAATRGQGDSFMDRLFGHRKSKYHFEAGLVFVIMSFSRRGGGKTSGVFSAIKDECAKLNLRATRVDENVGAGFIFGETISLIERAEFIICDLTRERPNVYYELGYAHGLGNEPMNILLIAKEGTAIHFDIAPFRVEFYGSVADLREVIATTFKEMVRLKREEDERLLQNLAPAAASPTGSVGPAPANASASPIVKKE